MYRREFALSSVAALLSQPQCANRLYSQFGVGDAGAPVADDGPVADGELAGPAKGPWRRLFLDATIVEEQQGLTRRF